MDSTSRLDRWVLTALAVYDQPVPPVAVDFLLDPYLHHVRSEATLERLCRRRVIKSEGGCYYIPSTGDTSLILEGIPVGEEDDFQEESFELTRRDLAIQAAQYYEETARMDPAQVEDLGPQFSEVEQRIRGGDFEGALLAVSELDDQWLCGWGQRHLAMPWLRRILDGVSHPQHRVSVLSMLVNSYMEIGKYLEAKLCIEEACAVPQEKLDSEDLVSLLIQAGTATYEYGQISIAKGHYLEALSGASRHQLFEETVKSRSGLVLCCTEMGDLSEAAEHLSHARRVMDEHPIVDRRLFGQLDLNE